MDDVWFDHQMKAAFIIHVIIEELCISPWMPLKPGQLARSRPCVSPYYVGELSTYIGAQIHAYRKRRKMSQEKLAQLVHLDAGRVSHHEHGEGLTINVLPLYASALNCELSDLLPPGKKDLYETLEDRIAHVVKRLLTIYELPPEQSEDIVTIVERTLNLAVPKSKALPDRDEK